MEEKCCSNQECSGFRCPITGFKFCCNKKFSISAIIMLIWVNFFSWLWHGKIMSTLYQQTANLWRGPEEMKVIELNLGLSLTAIAAAYIFMKGYEHSGLREGLRFGIVITALFSGMGLVTHATQPVPYVVILMWCLGDFIMYSLGGIGLCLVYSKICKSACKQGECH